MDVFSGCGGASLGFKLNGFDIAYAVDINEAACATYRANLKLTPQIEDVTNLSGKDILEFAGLKKGEPTVMIFCAPCQGFTELRKRKYDKRNKLVFRSVDLIGQVKPEFVFFENVPGILKVSNGKYMRFVRRKVDQVRLSLRL